MLRREFLKGTAGVIAVGVTGNASAQELKLPAHLLDIIRVNFCQGEPKTRRNVYTLYNSNPNHPIIEAYRQGVAVMRGRAPSDPLSWDYQANIHGTTLAQTSWPPGAPFATCEHNTNFFLSWHRMYVYFFERIVRASSGYADFALPYWNYGKLGEAALPPPFRNPTTGATPNSLFDGTRSGAVNAGNPLPASAVDPSMALSATAWASFQSTLEGTPHGAVHVSIGGNMGNFPGAGHDPIFWLHHCNIDRLWEKWLSQGGGRADPTGDSAWMHNEYTFVDECRQFVRMTGAEIIQTATQLHYQYDDPQNCIPLYLVAASLAGARLVAAKSRVLTSFLLARHVRISPAQDRIELRPEDPITKERLSRDLSVDALVRSADSGVRYLLIFEGVKTDAPANGYFEVYVGLPRDANPDYRGPYYAGNLALFGADAQSRQSMKSMHAGHATNGITVELDSTDLLKRLVERGLAPNDLSVTLVPMGVGKEQGERFTFDPKSLPQIDAVVLTAVKEE